MGRIVRHKVRGTTYRILMEGTFNSSNEAFDRKKVVIYQDVDHGNVEVRLWSEFTDGRFEEVQSTPADVAKET